VSVSSTWTGRNLAGNTRTCSTTVIETYDLDQAQDVLRRLKNGKVRARAVLLV